MTLPLSGVRVAEFCEYAAGPFTGMLLADLGADVVKIERPGGDALRLWPPLNRGYSENFASVNRNKRSVMLDLRDRADRATAGDLAVRADVVLENYRPGVMAKYGLDYATLSGRRPDLVYCSISAFGQSGPRAKQGGFDLTLQAIAGIMSVTGDADSGPAKCGVPISDFATGLYAALAVAAALLGARESGRGAFLDISMFGASLGISALQASEYFGSGKNPVRMGSAHPRNAPYEAFPAADGYIVLAAGNDALWRKVCGALGCSELIDDTRFRTTTDRARNQDQLRALLLPAFKRKTVSQWLDILEELGVPAAPLNSYADALGDAQTDHLGLVQTLELPNGAMTRTVACPIQFSGEIPPIRRPPPALDQHRDQVLSEWLATPVEV